MKNIYLQILEHRQDENKLALVTVTGTSGSTPRKSGSSALFDQTGLISGTIGGGITEKKVQDIAQTVLQKKTSGLFSFTLDKDMSSEDEAICGGQMNVLVDAEPGLNKAVFEKIRLSLREGIPGVLITNVKKLDDQHVEIKRYWHTGIGNDSESYHHIRGMDEKIKSMLAEGKNGDYIELQPANESQDFHVFIELLHPPLQLIIAGAGHIGKALAHLGRLLDFEVTVIDDRSEYANSANIPDADNIIVDDPGHAIKQLNKTKNTYVVIVTRGHKSDADALRYSIGSEAAYVGMIGSRKKIALIRKKSIDEGWATAGHWAKIHAPVGLPINSESVQEIAMSIAAQLIMERNS